MHDSYTPMGGLAPLVMIQLGEVVFGGVGSGLYVMLVFAIVAVFIAGLMVGRTPEYLGKKIETYEMKMASLIILIPVIAILVGTMIGVATGAGRASVANPGAHGFSEILYALHLGGGQQRQRLCRAVGQHHLLQHRSWASACSIGRFWILVPTLALAGSLAKKKHIPRARARCAPTGPCSWGC